MRKRWSRALVWALLAGLTGPAAITVPATADGGAGTRSIPASQSALLKRDVGVWDATIQILGEPDGAMDVYNGTETNTLVPGGRWLETDFKSRIGGEDFEGHALFGYDPDKRKYVRIWVDSSQAFFWPSEGDYDPATDSLTMWMESNDSNGQVVRWRTVTVWKDAETRVFTMYVPGPETTEAAGMTITYKRRG
jgi:hypothetical protein